MFLASANVKYIFLYNTRPCINNNNNTVMSSSGSIHLLLICSIKDHQNRFVSLFISLPTLDVLCYAISSYLVNVLCDCWLQAPYTCPANWQLQMLFKLSIPLSMAAVVHSFKSELQLHNCCDATNSIIY